MVLGGVLGTSLNEVDFTIVVVYITSILSIGLYQAWRQRSIKEKDKDKSYFLAGRDMHWIVVGTSLFSSNIGTEHFIGLAGDASDRGILPGCFELYTFVPLLLLAYVFVPVYIKSKISTTPEWISRRFNSHCRTYMAFFSILTYIVTKISVCIFAAAILLEEVAGWDIFTSSIILVTLTGIYSTLGGLRAVVYTEVVQTVVLLVGGLSLMAIAFTKVGGLAGLRSTMPEKMFHFVQPASDPVFPWVGVFFGAPIGGIYYWCTDQLFVQRCICAKNLGHAQAGSVFAGFLKPTTFFMLVIPGIIAKKLWPTEIGAHSDMAYPYLITRLMPKGLVGLMIASMLSALMSSLASIFNSTSTIISYDVYKRLRPETSPSRLVLVGKIGSVVMMLVSMAWIPMITRGDHNAQMHRYIQSMSSNLQPPVAAVFLLGIFWDRANSAGAMAGLFGGLFVSALRIILEFGFDKNADLSVLTWMKRMPFLVFSTILFVISALLTIVVSLLTKPPEKSQIEGNTFWSTKKQHGKEPESIQMKEVHVVKLAGHEIQTVEDVVPISVENQQGDSTFYTFKIPLGSRTFEVNIVSVAAVLMTGVSVSLWIIFW
eukprot:278526_1